jgi:Holliday junction resolvase RusA-like endonuclease
MKFKVKIKPMGKASVRVTKFNTYIPDTSRNFMNTIAWEFRKAFKGHKLIVNPISLTIRATFEPPTSWSKKKRLLALEGKYRAKKPDSSNIIKGVEDALNGVAYKDDNQVVILHIEKWYGEEDSVEIEIVELNN